MGDADLHSPETPNKTHLNLQSPASLDVTRSEINEYLGTLDYESAIFWSRYIFETSNETHDLFKLVQCLTQAGQYNRALAYQTSTTISSKHNLAILPFRLLFGTCFVKIEQYDKALDLLQEFSEFDHAVAKEQDFWAAEKTHNKENNNGRLFNYEHQENKVADVDGNTENNRERNTEKNTENKEYTNPEIKNNATLNNDSPNKILKPTLPGKNFDQNSTSQSSQKNSVHFNINQTHNTVSSSAYLPNVNKTLAGKYVLLAQIYDIQQNPNIAFECLKHALFFDNKCAAAWQRIKRKRYLSSAEENDLVKSGILPAFQSQQTTDSQTGSISVVPSFLQLSTAEGFFNKHNIQECYKITRKLIIANMFDWDVLPLHLATLVEFEDESKTTELFKLSHALMDACPGRSISWYKALKIIWNL